MKIKNIYRYCSYIVLSLLGLNFTYALNGAPLAADDNARTVIPMLTIKYQSDNDNTKNINYCGGALIGNQYLITALHCLDSKDYATAHEHKTGYSLKVLAFDTMPPLRHSYSNASIYIPRRSNGNPYSDLAVLDLGPNATLNNKKTQFQLALPAQAELSSPDDLFIKIAGASVYGFSDSSAFPLVKLQQKAVLPANIVLPEHTDQDHDPNSLKLKNVKTYSRDSGSPVISYTEDHQEAYLTGIVVANELVTQSTFIASIEPYSSWIASITDNSLDINSTIVCHIGKPCYLP